MEKKIEQSHIKFNLFENYPLVAAFSTRLGGQSQGVYSAMNLSFSTGDDRNKVLANYRIFAEDIGVDFEKMVLSSQIHKDTILIATEEHRGMGTVKEKNFSDVDGLYTETKGLAIATGHADCTPIFFYDRVRNAIGLAHSGWRGTSKKIGKKMIDLFVEKGSNTKDILCAIGPTICLDCYEVGKEVVEAIENSMPIYKKKPHIDLKDINRRMLLKCGVLAENIEVSPYCTNCDSHLFFSHRRYGKNRGGHAACMCLL